MAEQLSQIILSDKAVSETKTSVEELLKQTAEGFAGMLQALVLPLLLVFGILIVGVVVYTMHLQNRLVDGDVSTMDLCATASPVSDGLDSAFAIFEDRTPSGALFGVPFLPHYCAQRKWTDDAVVHYLRSNVACVKATQTYVVKMYNEHTGGFATRSKAVTDMLRKFVFPMQSQLRGDTPKVYRGADFMHSPDMLVYDRMVFDPSDPDPRTGARAQPSSVYRAFNLFEGFPFGPKHSMPSARRDSLVAPFLGHASAVLCAGDSAMFNYMMLWIAHLVQWPGVKPGTALLMTSRQGAGKNVFWEVVRDLVGQKHYVLLNRASASHRGSTLPLSTSCWRPNDNDSNFVLKSLITQHETILELKGVDGSPVSSFERYVLLSNDTKPLRIEASDRRFACFEVSELAAESEFVDVEIEDGQGVTAAGLYEHMGAWARRSNLVCPSIRQLGAACTEPWRQEEDEQDACAGYQQWRPRPGQCHPNGATAHTRARGNASTRRFHAATDHPAYTIAPTAATSPASKESRASFEKNLAAAEDRVSKFYNHTSYTPALKHILRRWYELGYDSTCNVKICDTVASAVDSDKIASYMARVKTDTNSLIERVIGTTDLMTYTDGRGNVQEEVLLRAVSPDMAWAATTTDMLQRKIGLDKAGNYSQYIAVGFTANVVGDVKSYPYGHSSKSHIQLRPEHGLKYTGDVLTRMFVALKAWVDVGFKRCKQMHVPLIGTGVYKHERYVIIALLVMVAMHSQHEGTLVITGMNADEVSNDLQN
ncbi:LOW QUALITY PROTEIN: hypothetical protein GHT06_003790 [Daphnia sinensis]|uniref:Uncharacterized protein n=1 Tax=Daphnia sinensis TaxID=1820382 RepID=A0AAD5KDW1_9CRUS|nr:LOW QUALITY PROTEIN: hypothetical protein GHT06_003790 [Daphnia sinensis]